MAPVDLNSNFYRLRGGMTNGMQRLHLLLVLERPLTPIASAGLAHTHSRCLALVPIAWCHQQGDWGSSRHPHLLTAPAPIALHHQWMRAGPVPSACGSGSRSGAADRQRTGGLGRWRRELNVCAMAALEAFERPGAPADRQPASSPAIKSQSGEASCLSASAQGLLKASAAPEAFGRPGAPADRQPAPPRSKAKAGELAGCLLRHKAFRKPPPLRRLSEGLVHQRIDNQLPRDQKPKRGSWLSVCSGTRPFESLHRAGGFQKA
ncbi:hypothetical protein QTO34_017282 [Cnephaeus nilssonii]|uniref:Uncharacterized protein n=1 Tax=Cnephaeus nilssonii TaxID=3371016 RepID=A0AA40I0T8_CNENI|nr:hypothetical protein QTO34_017282 [Eptesicus nilssonii]